MRKSTANQLLCYHCGSVCYKWHPKSDEKTFCCEGCLTVYNILNQNNLCNYYEFNNHPGLRIDKSAWKNRFDYLDLPEIKNKLILFSNGTQHHVQLHIPKMHCTSCLWLLENLHKLDPAIIYSRVNFTDKSILVVYNEPESSLKKLVELLTTIGYEPQIELNNNNKTIQPDLINKKRLLKIGIAGFCFANIMMMSLPAYFAGVNIPEKELSLTFSVISIILSIPVLLYCSVEFYSNAWKSIRAKFINIDFPIALAISLSFIRSIYEIFSGMGNGYLDSMSGIVFFMLVGRYVQDKSYQSLSYDRNYKSFFPIAVNVLEQGRFEPKPIEKIKIDDTILIHHQEIIPVDGQVIKGIPLLDYSFVTGESELVLLKTGDPLFAGAKQTGSNLEIKVTKPISQSYLTSLWNKGIFIHENIKKATDVDTLGQYFSIFVLVLAASAGFYWFKQNRFDLMWNSLTTILIVACPCALLLASSYTNAQVLKILAHNKLYLRHAEVLEKISKINHIVFDKTGTLTKNDDQYIAYHGYPIPEDLKTRIYSLAIQSTHPLSQSILHFLGPEHEPMEVHHFKQQEGKGIEAWIDEHHLKIGSADFLNLELPLISKGSTVHINEDGRYYGYFEVQQKYRNGLKDLIDKLSSSYNLSVISGDNNKELNSLKSIFSKSTPLRFNLNPEDKLKYIQELQDRRKDRVLMIGDGLNDAGALKQSNIGLAITENKNNFTPACDGILDGSSFNKINSILSFIKSSRTTILIIFFYSLIYNVIGGYYALNGILSPVIAAILMPFSSLSIVLLSYCLTELGALKNNLSKPVS